MTNCNVNYLIFTDTAVTSVVITLNNGDVIASEVFETPSEALVSAKQYCADNDLTASFKLDGFTTTEEFEADKESKDSVVH